MTGMDEEGEGDALDIRAIIEDELADAGMEQEEQLDQNFIDQVLTDAFFQQFDLEQYKPLKVKFFNDIKNRLGYPDKPINKEDLIQLLENVVTEFYASL